MQGLGLGLKFRAKGFTIGTPMNFKQQKQAQNNFPKRNRKIPKTNRIPFTLGICKHDGFGRLTLNARHKGSELRLLQASEVPRILASDGNSLRFFCKVEKFHKACSLGRILFLKEA